MLNNIIYCAYLHVLTPLGKKKNHQYGRGPSAAPYCCFFFIITYCAHMCMCLDLSAAYHIAK